ncbi:unnamed protein product [Victoria cruziana]
MVVNMVNWNIASIQKQHAGMLGSFLLETRQHPLWGGRSCLFVKTRSRFEIIDHHFVRNGTKLEELASQDSVFKSRTSYCTTCWRTD